MDSWPTARYACENRVARSDGTLTLTLPNAYEEEMLDKQDNAGLCFNQMRQELTAAGGRS